jgi:hypothetical protein
MRFHTRRRRGTAPFSVDMPERDLCAGGRQPSLIPTGDVKHEVLADGEQGNSAVSGPAGRGQDKRFVYMFRLYQNLSLVRGEAGSEKCAGLCRT